MPLVWCLGYVRPPLCIQDIKLTILSSIVGPMVGGALARPVVNFPNLFAAGSIWDRYPYLLPNLFSAFWVFVGLFVGILFLEETHSEKKHQRDRGLELGAYLLSCLPWSKGEEVHTETKDPERRSLLETEEPLPGYCAIESPSDDNAQMRRSASPEDLRDQTRTRQRIPTKIFTRSVVLNIVSYGILAL
jgi:hypothetical protein